ncbi:hypothetical protein DFH11DRAFT_1726831 [Phellopilus nigrolimitatus]|nr:hypothetical protein DFH11DRAFT_1726831 [Phellopilus nigrolimitatus]
MAKKANYGYGRQDLEALLAERDQQNTFLRSQLQARIDHNTHLEARLLTTLDTLDELQASATLDLQQAQHENARLVRKLEVYRETAKVAEKEKEDMSNAVLQLVAKVESCNDYTKWHATRMQLSRNLSLHPQQIANSSFDPVSSGLDCTCPRTYAPAIVEELAESLSREQRAHSLTAAEAERRLAALHYGVASRDAEIARRVAGCRCLPVQAIDREYLDLLSDDERIHIAAHTEKKNHALEAETILLERELVRDKRSSLSAFSRRREQAVQTEASISDSVFHSPRNESQDRSCSSFPPSQTSRIRPVVTDDDDDDDATMPAALSALDAQIAQLRGGLSDLASEKEKLQRVLRDELMSKHSLDIEDRDLRHGATPGHDIKDCGVYPEFEDYYGEEKDAEEEFKNILLIEEECIRLIHSEDTLRAEARVAQRREKALNEENARLKEEMQKMHDDAGSVTSAIGSSPHSDYRQTPASESQEFSSQSPAAGAGPQHIEPSEIDLAFPPLLPISIPALESSSHIMNTTPSSSSSSSSASVLLTPTSLMDPSTIPLPGTPPFDEAIDTDEHNPAPPPEGALLRSTSPHGSETQSPDSLIPNGANPRSLRDPESIARELADVRADAEQREREIAEVRDVIASLDLRGVRMQGVEDVWGAVSGREGEDNEDEPSS